MFFKDLDEINKKEKDKTTFKISYNRITEVRWTILKIGGDVLLVFGLWEKNQTFMKV